MTRVVASIEARMGSSRLPGKVLADVQGIPALTHLLKRLRRVSSLDDIVLATTRTAADDVLEEWAQRERVRCFRGSEDDVLERVVEAHRVLESDIIVEVTGDCILLDPDVIDMGIETFAKNACDIVTNARVPSYPMGADVQVFRYDDLLTVEQTVDDPAVREHVSLYFYEHPERYRVVHLVAPPRWRAPQVRLQLDYEEDLQFIRQVYERFAQVGEDFGLEEIMQLLKREPQLALINQHCAEKKPR